MNSELMVMDGSRLVVASVENRIVEVIAADGSKLEICSEAVDTDGAAL